MSEVPSVYHQLGFENADELVIKSELVSSIHAMIKARNLTQEQAGTMSKPVTSAARVTVAR